MPRADQRRAPAAPPGGFYRKLPQIPVITDASVVMSRHASPYSTFYHSPLPAIVSLSHYENALFCRVLQAGK